MKLTDTKIANIKVTDKVQKVADGGGLYLHISPAGGKLWRMAYRFDGKQKTLSFGAYPYVSLKDARDKREAAKTMLARDIDPGAHKQAVKASRVANVNSYEVVTREWFLKYSASWSASNQADVMARQEKNVFPFLGARLIDSITAPELLEAVRRVEQRGNLNTAHRLLRDCGRIFRYAIATGRAERDPAAALQGALPPAKSDSFASITKPAEVGALLRAIDGYEGNVIVAHALKLAPLVFVRPGELRAAQWQEFDFEAAEWRIPAERMKMKQTHIVPLSLQSVAILDNLRLYSGHGEWLFPSSRAKPPLMSDAALSAALRGMGYTKEQMTAHGFRHMASTLLNELGYNRDWIERQLAHGERNSIRAAYNYAEYLPERRRMMQEWANYLDTLKANR